MCVFVSILSWSLSAWHGMFLIFRQRRQPPDMDISCKFIEEELNKPVRNGPQAWKMGDSLKNPCHKNCYSLLHKDSLFHGLCGTIEARAHIKRRTSAEGV